MWFKKTLLCEVYGMNMTQLFASRFLKWIGENSLDHGLEIKWTCCLPKPGSSDLTDLLRTLQELFLWAGGSTSLFPLVITVLVYGQEQVSDPALFLHQLVLLFDAHVRWNHSLHWLNRSTAIIIGLPLWIHRNWCQLCNFGQHH